MTKYPECQEHRVEAVHVVGSSKNAILGNEPWRRQGVHSKEKYNSKNDKGDEVQYIPAISEKECIVK